MRFPGYIVIKKNTKRHSFQDTKDRPLVYNNLKFKGLLFLPRLKNHEISLR